MTKTMLNGEDLVIHTLTSSNHSAVCVTRSDGGEFPSSNVESVENIGDITRITLAFFGKPTFRRTELAEPVSLQEACDFVARAAPVVADHDARLTAAFLDGDPDATPQGFDFIDDEDRP